MFLYIAILYLHPTRSKKAFSAAEPPGHCRRMFQPRRQLLHSDLEGSGGWLVVVFGAWCLVLAGFGGLVFLGCSSLFSDVFSALELFLAFLLDHLIVL